MKLLVLEHNNECELIKIFHQIINSEEHQLSRKYMDKFYSKFKLAVRIMIICWKISLLLFCIILFTSIIIAYFDPEMNFSIITMSIWFVILVISFYYAISIAYVASIYTYLISLYMKYRFKQVQDLIEIYLKRGNTFKSIQIIISSHIYTF